MILKLHPTLLSLCLGPHHSPLAAFSLCPTVPYSELLWIAYESQQNFRLLIWFTKITFLHLHKVLRLLLHYTLFDPFPKLSYNDIAWAAVYLSTYQFIFQHCIQMLLACSTILCSCSCLHLLFSSTFSILKMHQFLQ